MNWKIIKAFFIIALFTTSCLAQAPAPTPTTTVTTPPPAPTDTPPSDVPTASPPAPEGPGVSPGDLIPSPSVVSGPPPPPNAAFSNKAFVVGTAFAVIIYSLILA